MSDQIVVGDKLKVSRDQLAKFIDNHEVIKQFEKLFATVKYLEEVVEELETYIEVGDTDYEFTTQDTEMTYIVFDGLTADRTVTVTDGGFDERSRFKIVNKDSTYKVIVKDITENIPHWVIAGQTAEFYDLSNSLTWSSAGDEYVYITPTPLTGPNVIASTALSTGFIVRKGAYDINCYGGGLVATGVVNVDKDYAAVYAAVLPAASNAYLYYLLSSDSFTYNQGPIETIKLRHDAA